MKPKKTTAVKKTENFVGEVFSVKRVSAPQAVKYHVTLDKGGSLVWKAPGATKKARVPGTINYITSHGEAAGQLIINGVNASTLVNKFPRLKMQGGAVKPKHLSQEQISSIVKQMKVA